MTKQFCLLMAACMLLSLAACGARGKEPEPNPGGQTATAAYRLYGQATEVVVDLSGGWSVNFADDSVYLYNGANDGVKAPVASGRVIDKAEYDANAEASRGYSTFTATGGGFKFSEGEGGSNKYLFAVGNGVYFMIAAEYGAGAESIYARFDVHPGDGLPPETAEPTSPRIDYLMLVNKLNPLPDGWEDAGETAHMTNSLGDDVEVEARACAAYLQLKEALEKDGVYVDLYSARRSAAKQQEIIDRFTGEYGAEYAARTVAAPGYSEHHTGLALDLYLNVDGKDVYPGEEMLLYPEIWEKIHGKLADYGFILRYLRDKEHITGCGYEPWHIRYVGDAETAGKIMSAGITLEEYLGAASGAPVAVDLGSSMIYEPSRLNDAAVQIKCEFASFAGCELQSLRYAGDECNSVPNVEWLSSLAGVEFYQVAEFLCDFRTGADAGGTLEPNQEYKDYPWWLGRTRDGGWELVSHGY